jgi:ZIP family zinc transporter
VVAASSLVVGAGLGVVRQWKPSQIGVVLGFGAGALVSSISFELFQDGLDRGGALPLALGLATRALAFFFADRGVERLGGRLGAGSAGLPLALGALLDGIPEQAVLGLGIAQGQGVSIALLVAIFVSNLPESIGSSTDMKAAGDSSRRIITLWAVVAAACTLATLGGYAISRIVRGCGGRLRRRRPARHVGRVDDPRGHREGPRQGRPGRRPRLRGGRGTVGDLLGPLSYHLDPAAVCR